MKFLRARSVPLLCDQTIIIIHNEIYSELKVAEAETMMIATLRWREEFNVDKLMSEETFPEDVFGPVGRIFGKDKGGRPVTYVPIILAR